MKRVLSLAAFCCMVLNVGIVLDAEAKTSNQQRIEELETNRDVRNFIKLRKDTKIKNFIKLKNKYLKQKKDQDIQDYLELRQVQTVQEYLQLKREMKENPENRGQVLNKRKRSTMKSNNSDYKAEDESSNSEQISNRKRRYSNIDSNSRDESNNFGYDADNESSDSEQTPPKKTKKKKKRRSKRKTYTLNEPIIDGAKLQKSSVVVEKDIKLANKDESKNVEKKISPTELSPLDKKEVLAQNDSAKDLKLAANFDDSKKEIKEKLLQVNNSRKSYNLIRTPNKKLKNNIQVSKFREELNRYRRLYSANLKKA